MQVSTLLRFSNVCPFLGHSTVNSLRSLAGATVGNNASQLTATAMQCPMMGPKLAQIGNARSYASVAGNREVEEIHKVCRSLVSSLTVLTLLRSGLDRLSAD